MKFSTSALVCAIAAFTPALVSAHGFLGQMTIDGKVYKGNSPGSGGAASAIRQVADINPIYGAGNKAINCGTNAKPAALNAVANAGSSIAFKWTGGGGQNWPHNTGPVITYMASCGSTTCDKFDSTKAKWFKIGQAGKNGNNVWEQAKFQSGQSLSSTIPANLASGNYLVRSEIIALHAADYLGAEYYPACAQLIVKGNGKGTPSGNELVSIPGAYSDKVNNVSPYTNGAYKFPGPAIAKLAASSANLAVEIPAAPVPSSPEAASPATEDDEDIPYCDEEEDTDSEDSDEEPTPPAAEQDAPNKAAINPTKYANSTEKSNKPYGRATHPRSMSRIMRNIVFSS